MSDETEKDVSVTKVRIESLKGNRNFFTVLLTIESAILTIAGDFFGHSFRIFEGAIIFLFLSIILLLFGVFLLTDSIHQYSKNLEYLYMWNVEVHAKAKNSKNKSKEEMANKALKRALEADGLGYYCLKLSLLSFVYFLVLFSLTVLLPQVESQVLGFIIIAPLITVAAVYCYKTSHMKNWEEAFIGYFVIHSIFSKEESSQNEDDLILKNPTSSLFIGTLLGLLLGILGNLFVSLLFEDWINNRWYLSALIVSGMFIFGFSVAFWILAKRTATRNLEKNNND